MTQEGSMVKHPNHYQSKSGLEAWDVIKDFTADLKGAEAWGTQQALKYLLRWKHKNGKEDLEKAVNYIQELIKDIERAEAIEKLTNEVSYLDIPKDSGVVIDHTDEDIKYFVNTLEEEDFNECWDCERFYSSPRKCFGCDPLTHNCFKHK